MELRQLKYFKQACELQNFSEAARALHISLIPQYYYKIFFLST